MPYLNGVSEWASGGGGEREWEREESGTLFSWKLEREINRLCDGGYDLQEAVESLRELEFYLEERMFSYRNKKDDLPRGQRCLLRLWSYLLRYVDTVPARGGVRHLFLKLILLILRREEFSPRQIGLYAESTTVQCPLNSPLLQGILQYRKMVIETLAHAGKKCELPSCPPEYTHLAAQILAFAYFCLPMVSQHVLDTLADLSRVLQAELGPYANEVGIAAPRGRERDGEKDGERCQQHWTEVQRGLLSWTYQQSSDVEEKERESAAPSAPDRSDEAEIYMDVDQAYSPPEFYQRFVIESVTREDKVDGKGERELEWTVQSSVRDTTDAVLAAIQRKDARRGHVRRFISSSPSLFYWSAVEKQLRAFLQFTKGDPKELETDIVLLLPKYQPILNLIHSPKKELQESRACFDSCLLGHCVLCLLLTEYPQTLFVLKFIQALLEHVADTSFSPEIAWSTIPGYSALIRVYLLLLIHYDGSSRMESPSSASAVKTSAMKKPTAQTSPPPSSCCSPFGDDASLSSSSPLISSKLPFKWDVAESSLLFQAAESLLRNPDLLNPMIQITLENTSCFNLVSIDRCLDILQRLLPAAAYHHGRLQRFLRSQSEAGNAERWSGNRPRGSSYEFDSQSHTDEEDEEEDGEKGTLPLSLDLQYLMRAIVQLIDSRHFQILLKTLTFLYMIVDLLEGKRRQTLARDLLLHKHFFELFLHWNAEVRRMYHHILVFKLFLSSRLQLPCLTDEILVGRTRLMPKNGLRAGEKKRERGYGAGGGLLGVATSLFRLNLSPLAVSSRLGKDSLSPTSSPPGSPLTPSWPSQNGSSRGVAARPSPAQFQQRQSAFDLIAGWNAQQEQEGEREPLHAFRQSLFGASLGNEETSLDLSLASKIDAMLKMLTEQIIRRRQAQANAKKGPAASLSSSVNLSSPIQYYDPSLEVYVPRALEEYQEVLKLYYQHAQTAVNYIPAAPQLEFKVVVLDQGGE